jgi:hypothetical protein
VPGVGDYVVDVLPAMLFGRNCRTALPALMPLAMAGRPRATRAGLGLVNAQQIGAPLADYQTVFATQPGSAKMPSAGRPFTPELVTALVARGTAIAPVTLHARRLLAGGRRAALSRALRGA